MSTGWHMRCELVLVDVIGDVGVHVASITIGPTRLLTSPCAASPDSPIGSPGHSVTRGSDESKVRAALRSELTTKSSLGISQHPKPKADPLKFVSEKSANTVSPTIVIGAPPARRNVVVPTWTCTS